MRRKEAAEIAMLLHQIVGEQWQVLDREATDAREATKSEDAQDTKQVECYKDTKYSDICILMPTRTALRTLELALDDANVPYRLEGASLFFDTQEVRDLLNCLRAIDDPSNEIAIVAALRSPAFACTAAYQAMMASLKSRKPSKCCKKHTTGECGPQPPHSSTASSETVS